MPQSIVKQETNPEKLPAFTAKENQKYIHNRPIEELLHGFGRVIEFGISKIDKKG